MSENRYEITRLLGKGRTGGVYEAEDKNLNRKVAMRRFFDQGNRVDFTQHKEDFLQVARSLSNLQHPNLLRVFDAGVDEDGAYVVSQLLEGESLHEETKKGAMPLAEVVELAKQMLDAFSMAHDIGYFHGALTPDSILMVPRARGGYRYVILDMGLSRLAPLIQGQGSVLAVMADRAILAPELFDGGIANAQADLYMLGQIIFMCIAGGHPFGGLSTEEAKKKHLKGLPSIKKYNSDLSKGMIQWLSALTSVNPDNRPSSAVDALRSLQQISSSIQDTSAQRILSGLAPVPGSQINQIDAVEHLTGPVPILPPDINPEDIPVVSTKQKSKKPLAFIAIGAGVVLATIVGVAIFGGNDVSNEGEVQDSSSSDDFKSSIEQERSSELEEQPERVPRQSNNVKFTESFGEGSPPQEIQERLAYFSATDSKWEKSWPKQQTSIDSGWLIRTTRANSFPGVKYPLRIHTNKMFEKGWNLTYKVAIESGAHRVGFALNDAMNPGWFEGGDVGCCVVMKREEKQVILYSPADVTYTLNHLKSHTLDLSDENEVVTVTIEQETMAISGEYVVKLNGKQIFKDNLTKNINYEESEKWTNFLFCSTLDRVSKPSWVIEEFKLETL